MVAGRFANHDDAPSGDRIVLVRNTTWSDYQRMQEIRGDGAVPRLSFLEGVLEIMCRAGRRALSAAERARDRPRGDAREGRSGSALFVVVFEAEQ